jgi:hypothetical protein
MSVNADVVAAQRCGLSGKHNFHVSSSNECRSHYCCSCCANQLAGTRQQIWANVQRQAPQKHILARLLFKRVSAGDTPRLSPALLQILQCHRYVLRQTCSKQAQARGPVLPIKLCVAMRIVPNFTADGNDASCSRNRRRGPRLGDQKRAFQVVVRSIGQVRGGRPCRLGLLIRALSARLVVLEVTKHDLPAECYKQAADVQRCRHVSP